MEINITALTRADFNPAMYSGSIAEQGENVAKNTWNNALQRAAYGSTLLDTADKLEAMRKWALSSGGDFGELSDVELNALFIQLVSGDMREKGELSWPEHQEQSAAGQVSGCLFEGIDGQVYYSLEG